MFRIEKTFFSSEVARVQLDSAALHRLRGPLLRPSWSVDLTEHGPRSSSDIVEDTHNHPQTNSRNFRVKIAVKHRLEMKSGNCVRLLQYHLNLNPA